MGRFLVHVNHGGEDIAPAHLPLHERRRLGEVGLHLPPAPAREELRAGGDKGVHKHGAVLPGTAPRRLDPAVDFPAILLRGPDDVKIVPAPAGVNVRVAGVLLLGALVVGFQRPGWPRLAFFKSQNCVLCHSTSLLFIFGRRKATPAAVRLAWPYRPASSSYWMNRRLMASIRLTTALWVLYPSLSAIS